MDIDAGRFSVRVAASPQEIKAAQMLRYDVFVREMGAAAPEADHSAGLERDRFDAHFDHLILIDNAADAADPRAYVAGVYRVMTGQAAAKGPGHYSAPEFDLSPLLASGRRLLELGRSCIAKDYRGGVALQALWQGLAGYVLEKEIEVLFGVASFKGTAPQDFGQALSLLHHQHLAAPPLRVRALDPGRTRMDLFKVQDVDRTAAGKQLPNLIKSYLRLGGVVGQDAFIDHDFNTIDVCLILDTARMADRYRTQLTAAAKAKGD